MKIIFKKIKIENFKNLDFIETEFWNKTYIYGANETGKTTFADAISYVLIGKNSLGESQFEFIPINSEGLSPKVELEIQIEDNKNIKTVKLVRMYQAKQTKDGKFTGIYGTVCFINGLKIGPKEYEKWVEENICIPEAFRLIYDVRYFTENISTNGRERPWEAQRRLLFSICGIKSDIDMVKAKKRFNGLIEGLSQYDNVNQYLVKLKDDEKNCNREIEWANSKIKALSEKSESIIHEAEIKTICPMCGSKLTKNLKAKEITPLFSINELQESIKKELEKRAQICKMIDLCKDFIDMKCKLAQKKVNELLDGVQVEMFRKNKTNDELVSCCEIRWSNVLYRDLSYSTKFVISLKIVKAFQKFYNIQFPILVDNAESIDLELENSELQIIYLYKRDSKCPKCGNTVGRKRPDGMWYCKNCSETFKKKLEICQT